MSNQTYVCLGDYQALISEEKYDTGLTACGNNSCNLKGKPFVEGDRCQNCGKTFSKDSPHQH